MIPRNWRVLLSILIIALTVFGCAKKEESAAAVTEPIEIKMGTKMPAESIEGQGHQYFADLVSERSDGQIEIVIYPSEQLGDSTTEVNNVLSGAQDIYAEGLAFFSSYAPQVKIENLPYLFTSEEQFKEVMAGDFGKSVEADLEASGL